MGWFRDIWDRKKDGERRGERSFLRVVFVSTAIALVFLLVKKDNLIRWAQGGITVSRQRKEINASEKTIAELNRRIEALTNNRDSLERLAREKYNFAEKGDDVYIIR